MAFNAVNTFLLSSPRLAFRTAATLDRIPPPAAAISSYPAPPMRFSKSTSRGSANTGCVWQSISPGITTRPLQSSSFTFLRLVLSHGSRSSSRCGPPRASRSLPSADRARATGHLPHLPLSRSWWDWHLSHGRRWRSCRARRSERLAFQASLTTAAKVSPGHWHLWSFRPETLNSDFYTDDDSRLCQPRPLRHHR